MAQVVKLLLISCLLIGCDAGPPDPAPEDLTGEYSVESLYNVTPLQHDIITDAIDLQLRQQGKRCNATYFIRDEGEYEEGEHFLATACGQDFLVVFDLNQDKVISVRRVEN